MAAPAAAELTVLDWPSHPRATLTGTKEGWRGGPMAAPANHRFSAGPETVIYWRFQAVNSYFGA